MKYPNQFLIDGIDRLGKSTLAENIVKRLGFHLVIHSGKPLPLSCYPGLDNEKKEQFQRDCNKNIFGLLNSGCDLIFDRTHLGEMVYAPMYRGYSGDYVYEDEIRANTSKSRLILLTTSNFDMLEDDGKSICWDNKINEQELFLNAFNRSNIKDKVIVDVHNGSGGYKSSIDVLNEALKFS